jgi:hypothetical protein
MHYRDALGFYMVGDKKFYSKVQALQEFQLTHKYPTWHFNDSEFSKMNWKDEPPESLKELYKCRAMQLRQKYDYLILYYSGGVDSHNILMTYVENDIPLDEIITYGPYEIDRRQQSNGTKEQQLFALPFLEELKKAHRINTHALDTSTSCINVFNDDEWIHKGGAQLSPLEMSFNLYCYEPHMQDIFMKNSNVGIVRGIDKPRIFYNDNKFYYAFLDLNTVGGNAETGIEEKSAFHNLEYFYWTPHFPIVIKQAHILMNYFKSTPYDYSLLTHTNEFRENDYYDSIKPIIYPDTIPKTHFDLGKGASPTWHIKSDWFFSEGNESFKNWKNGLSEVERTIPKEFINGDSIYNGMLGIWTKWYQIG